MKKSNVFGEGNSLTESLLVFGSRVFHRNVSSEGLHKMYAKVLFVFLCLCVCQSRQEATKELTKEALKDFIKDGEGWSSFLLEASGARGPYNPITRQNHRKVRPQNFHTS